MLWLQENVYYQSLVLESWTRHGTIIHLGVKVDLQVE